MLDRNENTVPALIAEKYERIGRMLLSKSSCQLDNGTRLLMDTSLLIVNAEMKTRI